MKYYSKQKKQWFAIYVRPRAEKQAARRLQEIAIETYLPLKKTLKQWKDRKKQVEVPLFSSYIFVRVDEKEYYQIPIRLNSFVKYVNIGGERTPVRDSEIQTIKRMLDYTDSDIEVVNQDFRLNDTVEIVSGELTGLKGKLIELKGKKRIGIIIETIGSYLTVEIDKRAVERIPKT